MCESAMQRMNHIAGARALIKECRWNSKSPGIGGACFWLNVGMELLSCLHFNWRLSWDPDTWDMDIEAELVPSDSLFGGEELWAQRMVYICAKIANFRAYIFQNSDPQAQQVRLQQRCHEWDTYKRWCDEWAKCIPRSMTPVCYLQPWQTTSKSAFPEVWWVSPFYLYIFWWNNWVILTDFTPGLSKDLQLSVVYSIILRVSCWLEPIPWNQNLVQICEICSWNMLTILVGLSPMLKIGKIIILIITKKWPLVLV